MKAVCLIRTCTLGVLLGLVCGCATNGPTAPAETESTKSILAEAVPIGLKFEIDGAAPNRTLKISPVLNGDTAVGSVYRFMYDVRYVTPIPKDVHADPEQYLDLSDPLRTIEIATNGAGLDIAVPLIEKAPGSPAMEVFVSVALWRTGNYKAGTANSITVTYAATN